MQLCDSWVLSIMIQHTAQRFGHRKGSFAVDPAQRPIKLIRLNILNTFAGKSYCQLCPIQHVI